MKLTGDAVILGCLAKPPISGNILDIGCGCGILSLMMAQQSMDAQIHAIDIDKSAIDETQRNFESSPWKNRLWVSKISVQQYASEKMLSFRHIICNPPYFNHSLQSKNEEKRQARHTVTLSMEELFHSVEKLMTNDASFWVIFPETDLKQNLQIAMRNNLFAKECTHIKHREKDNSIRVVVCFTKNPDTDCIQETLIIKDDNNQDSDTFQKLTQDFYLK